MNERLSIALPKGRLGKKVYGIFERAGYACPDILEDNRKLIFNSEDGSVQYFWAKPSDVAVYVERGAADIGVVGSDILTEQKNDVYELMDMGVGKCRIAIAAAKGFKYSQTSAVRVATKFPRIAREFFLGKSMDADIIILNGSIELAPILGMSDVILDIVETGETLRENDLYCVETVCDISARLIANKVSYKFKNARIRELCGSISAALTEDGK